MGLFSLFVIKALNIPFLMPHPRISCDEQITANWYNNVGIHRT